MRFYVARRYANIAILVGYGRYAATIYGENPLAQRSGSGQNVY